MDVNDDNDLAKEEDVRLRRARNRAFVAMLFAAAVAFGASGRVLAATAVDDGQVICNSDPVFWWDILHCHQTPGGDTLTCSNVDDSTCSQLCDKADMGSTGVLPSTSCDDGPPLTFDCVCGVHNGG